MRVPVLAAAVAAIVVAGIAPPSPAGIARPSRVAARSPWAGPRVTHAVLGNGLRVVVVENHAEPLADVAIWYRFGSADDPPGRLGVAHALEHMMFRGTHALSGTGLDRAGARFGSDANAETDLDYTHYFQTVPVGAVSFAMHVEADRMRGLLLGARDWRLEREAVLTEIADDDWLDRGRTEDAIRGRAFGGTAFAHDPGGTARDVRRIGVADLRRAYDKAYRPQNAMLVVTGDVDPSSIVDLARRLFGPIRGGRRFRHASAEPVVARGFVERLRGANSDLVDVALESRGLDANDESAEELALELIMPGHAVLRRLLVNEGPCDSYDVDDDSQAHGGLIHVLCVPDAGHTVDTALRGVRHALRELPSRVTPADIAYARRRDILETTYSCDSLRDEADLFGQTYALVGKDPRTIDRATARVSDAAVIAVLRRWSTPVAAAIARGARDTEMVHAGRHVRVEHVAPAPLDADVEPAWARSVPTLRPARLDPLETFALPNGVRVFFQPRPGNGTVYLRGSLERHTAQSYPRSATWRTAERHAIVMDGDSPSGMHGVSRDLPVMLSFLAAMWRVHEPMPRPPARRTFPWPQEAWIAMTGDVDPSVVRADVARVFGAWHRPVPPNAPSPAPTPFPAREISFGARGPSVRGALLFPAPKRGSPESATMEMLVGVLGDGSASDARLMREIRTRRGLVYGIGTLYDPDHGIFFVWYESTQAHFAAAHTAVRDVLDAVRAGAISTQERDRAYDDLVADALRDESSPDGIIDLLGQAAKEHRTPDDPQSLAARYAVVSRDDLRRLAARELRFEHVIDFDEGRGR